jgi:hypothetical protein
VHPLERAIRSSDGILSTAELHHRGFDDDTIKLVASYKKIVPIRRGWYASPDLPVDAFRALVSGADHRHPDRSLGRRSARYDQALSARGHLPCGPSRG